MSSRYCTQLKRNGDGSMDLSWGFVERILAGVMVVLLAAAILSQFKLHLQVARIDERLHNVEQRLGIGTRPDTSSLVTR